MKGLPLGSACCNSSFGLSLSCLVNGNTGKKQGREKTRKLKYVSLLLICLWALAHGKFSHWQCLSAILFQLLDAQCFTENLDTDLSLCYKWSTYKATARAYRLWNVGKEGKRDVWREGGVGLCMQILPWSILINLLKLLLTKLNLCEHFLKQGF